LPFISGTPELEERAQKYVTFQSKIACTNYPLLGVRMPDLRKAAKKLSKNFTLENAELLINECHSVCHSCSACHSREHVIPAEAGIYSREHVIPAEAGIYSRETHTCHSRESGNLSLPYNEQILILGFLINSLDITNDQFANLTKSYLLLCDSWGHIDSFVQRSKKFHNDYWFEFASSIISNSNSGEFEIRYAVIMYLYNFLTPDYIDRVFGELSIINHNGYYVRIAMSWLYAEAAVNFYDKTLANVNMLQIDMPDSDLLWVKKKAYTKMLESFRFTDAQKTEIREYRSKA
jgi:hypothetical protein